jgi:hypothetical protein
MDILVQPDRSLADANAVTTLEAARDRARQHHADHPDQTVTIRLAAGVHRLSQTLVLGHEDAHTVWCADDDAPVIVTGAVPVAGWRKLESANEPKHLAPEARGKVWVADVPASVGFVRTVLQGNRQLPRARGAGFARVKIDGGSDDPCKTFGYPEGAMDDWPDLVGADLVVIPRHPWTMNVLPLERVDTTRRIAHTAAPCTYPIGAIRRTDGTFIENTLAVLREPGMWVYHQQTHQLYHWPVDDQQPDASIAVSSLSELIRIEGTINEQAAEDDPVRDIHFAGISFVGGAMYPWHGKTGRGLQHDWDRFDEPTAMLRFRGAEDCSVERCSFCEAGSGGVRLDLHAQRIRIEGNHFTRLGGTGITLAGYGLGTKDVNRENIIRNNHIHDVSDIYWHSPGIFIWQSGSNTVSHNHVHHVGYTGIVCSGRTVVSDRPDTECVGTIRWDEVTSVFPNRTDRGAWHEPQLWRDHWLVREPFMHSRLNRIEFNDIHDVMQILGDGNGIYISGAGRGNIVRGNFIHDCPSDRMSEGIRCDDDQHDTLIESNVVVRLGGDATGLCSKGVNDIVNNIVAETVAEKTARGMISLEVGPMHGATIERNIVVANTAQHGFYYQKRLDVHGTGPDPLLRDAATDRNVYWCLATDEHAKAHLAEEQALGVEQNSIVADPKFVDPANDDWQLTDDSPAIALGIESLDARQAGPRADLPLPPDHLP